MVKHVFNTLIFCFCSATASEHAGAECRFGQEYLGPDRTNSLTARDVSAVPVNGSRLVDEKFAERLRKTLSDVTTQFDTEPAPTIAYYSEDFGYWSSSNLSTEHPLSLSFANMVTAVIIGQLMEEKQLLLEGTVERWFPELPDSDLITIAHLLEHTSGLVAAKPRHSGANNNQAQTAFCPGSDWRFSHMGYLLLASIAEKLDQEPFANIVNRRISRPLNLPLFFVSRRAQLIAPLQAKTSPDNVNNASATADGKMALMADGPSALRFLASYLGGDLVSDSIINDALRRPFPMANSGVAYGHGITVTALDPLAEHSVWLGHRESHSRGDALLIYDVKRRIYLSIFSSTPGSANRIATALLSASDEHKTAIQHQGPEGSLGRVR